MPGSKALEETYLGKSNQLEELLDELEELEINTEALSTGLNRMNEANRNRGLLNGGKERL